MTKSIERAILTTMEGDWNSSLIQAVNMANVHVQEHLAIMASASRLLLRSGVTEATSDSCQTCHKRLELTQAPSRNGERAKIISEWVD